MKTFKIRTLGCKVNQCDSRSLMSGLINAGFASAKDQADFVVVNSCAVTKTAIRKSRQMITKARRENPDAKIILTGCWPKIYRVPEKTGGVDMVWTGKDCGQLIKKADKLLITNNKFQIFPKPENSRADPGPFAGSEILNPKSVHFRKSSISGKTPYNRARYFLKIQDGCEQFCSYCIIPYARGKMKSRPAREVLAEARAAVSAGLKEIVVCGIHLGLYGREAGGNNDLAGLIKELILMEDLGRIRLSSIEVREVSDGLIDLMKNRGKICPHLHIPLQSGSDKILKSMNRPYNTKYYKSKIRKIRKALPLAAITTDVIAGFPGETEADFKKTHDLVKQLKFSRLHVFPFSAHENTKAAKLPGRIDQKIVSRRRELLQKIGEKLKNEYAKKFIGRSADVLIEKMVGDKCSGKTEYYFDAEFKKDLILKNSGNDALIRAGEIVRLAKITKNQLQLLKKL